VKQRDATAAFLAAAPDPVPAAAPAGPKQDDPYESAPGEDKSRLQGELAANEREIQARKRGSKPDTASENTLAKRIVALETEWRQLYRARDQARKRQSDTDDRLTKAQAAAASELGGYNSQVEVLDPAFLPKADGANPKTKFTLIGIVASLFAGLVFAAAWGMFLDDRLFMAEELAGLAPILGVIPKAHVEKGKRRA
jgi:hypothetical protein